MWVNSMRLLKVLKVCPSMDDLKRYTVNITGIVQGLGMRPYIYKTAKQLGLGGWVSNQGADVVM